MAQLTKRNLRDRRPPRNFDSEEQDDPYGYAKPSYTKVNRDFTQEARNPTAQLNLDAKLFIRFIHSINKNYKEHCQDRRRNQEGLDELSIKDKKVGRTDLLVDSRRKTTEPTQLKMDGKKTKEFYNFKTQGHQESNEPQKTQQFLNKIKGMTAESAVNMLNLERNIARAGKTFDRNKIMENSGELGAIGQSKANSSSGKNGSKNSFFSKDKQKGAKMNEIEEKLGIPRPIMGQQKLFKRSAYHVAIAYHIYLRRLKEKGTLGNEIDPTYYAKKLKEEMGRNH